MLHPTPLSGQTYISLSHWTEIENFIKSRIWLTQNPALPEDLMDPLLKEPPPYGAFMMGFDFHLTSTGPKLIEINTNAGGLASLIQTCPNTHEKEAMQQRFIRAIEKEYSLSGQTKPLKKMAILDDDIQNQWLYHEMLFFKELLEKQNYIVDLKDPQELNLKDPYDFIYNRLTDFRFTEERHKTLRQMALDGLVVISPHPALYVRAADKRNFMIIQSPLIPKTYLLKNKTLPEWEAIRKKFVFKPPTGAASRGVYRGDHISVKKLITLPPDTLVQELIPPPLATDGTKYDIRVFTHDTDILGVASRHFKGQVMEMRSEGSGIRFAAKADH